MAPKKKGGEEVAPTRATNAFTETEKTFLELQIADCNRKIARLRTTVDEYEQRNEELQKAYDKLDEDRADIIAYLKKTLHLKSEENNELKERVKGLEETREIETTEFKKKIAELEKNFTTMKDQLTSENKLLAGKLNTLEEFRAIRDDLMKKFDKQEQDFKDQEMKYKRVIYDAEKKFVIGKDKLKKEMEARLLQLAQDFQDATELRIAASTHRVIRENIAINNELDSILATQAKLADQNERFKESEKAARVAMELAEEERDKAINKNVVQLKVIDQLTNAFEEIKKDKALFEKRNYDYDQLQAKLQRLTKENDQLSLQVRILEQNLHARMCEQNKSEVETLKVVKEFSQLRNILKEAAASVQAALKLDGWAMTDPTRELMDRQVLLSQLLTIITQYHELERAESVDTLASLGKVYEEGDLGFIPKAPTKKTTQAVSSSVAMSMPSKEYVGEEKSVSSSSLSSSLGSLRTIPSKTIIPVSTAPKTPEKASLLSFVTSSKSSVTESEKESEHSAEELDDIEKQLAASKAEIQKSILKDLAYSQIAMQSQARFSESGHRKSTLMGEEKIEEGDESAEGEEKTQSGDGAEDEETAGDEHDAGAEETGDGQAEPEEAPKEEE